MRLSCLLLWLVCVAATLAQSDGGRPLPNVSRLPFTPDPNFQFRKTKIYEVEAQVNPRQQLHARNATTASAKSRNPNSTAVTQEQSLLFERAYRLWGAVTPYEQRQRFGEYFDFFWRAKQPSDVTVRFEYKQEKLRAFVQAKELEYKNAHGTCHSEFQVIGDEFANDGHVLAWRCLLIANNRIVAEKRSFLWDQR
ncbi:MAG: hypothetical protein JO354_07545 [Verrucomicrobia bacterium]|nr:hypothetical protein [Verrucomicrobiota bacterium]